MAGKLITSRIEISNALISFERAYEWRASSEPDFDKHQMLPVQIKWIQKEGDCTGGHSLMQDLIIQILRNMEVGCLLEFILIG